MSGSMRPMTRVQVASEMPFASARARKPSRHWSKPGGAVANAVIGLANRAPAPSADCSRARRVGIFGESDGFMGGILAAQGRSRQASLAPEPERFTAKACPGRDPGVDTGSREENASKQETDPRSDSIGTEKALSPGPYRATR